MRARDHERHENWLLDQRQGRRSARPARRGYSGGTAALGRRPGDRSRRLPQARARSESGTRTAPAASPEATTAFKAENPESIARQGRRRPRRRKRSRGCARRQASCAAKASARKAPRNTGQIATSRISSRSASPRCTTAAERAELAARDQIRRLPHGGAARPRRSAFADTQAAGLDAPLQAGRRGGRRACRPRPRCSTAKSSSRMRTASAISRCCRPI